MRSLFHLNRDDYLSEPEESISWMLNIDRVVSEVQAKRERDAQSKE
jgi:hypothetical protein